MGVDMTLDLGYLHLQLQGSDVYNTTANAMMRSLHVVLFMSTEQKCSPYHSMLVHNPESGEFK